jgi:N-acylglucosamine-6-phosphate 2-epimerase
VYINIRRLCYFTEPTFFAGNLLITRSEPKMKKDLNQILEQTKGSIIVSCQALPDEPLYCEEMSLMPFMAKAAQRAGSRCIRTSSVRDVIEIKKETGLPVIGLIKKVYEGYDSYITPTMQEIDELVAADSDIVALDCTQRVRGDGTTINEFLQQIREKYPDIVLMADVSTFEEGVNAWKCGVNIVGTTLSGYTPYSPKVDGPDYELVKKLVEALPIPVIAEGKVHYPDQAKKMLELGAHAVVVGGAITRPLEIAQRFFKAIEE